MQAAGLSCYSRRSQWKQEMSRGMQVKTKGRQEKSAGCCSFSEINWNFTEITCLSVVNWENAISEPKEKFILCWKMFVSLFHELFVCYLPNKASGTSKYLFGVPTINVGCPELVLVLSQTCICFIPNFHLSYPKLRDIPNFDLCYPKHRLELSRTIFWHVT